MDADHAEMERLAVEVASQTKQALAGRLAKVLAGWSLGQWRARVG